MKESDFKDQFAEAAINDRLKSVTRVELIDEGQRLVTRGYDVFRGDPGVQIEISLQDDGRTLKVFVKRRETAGSKAASAAAKVMKDPKASKDAKTLAANTMTQRTRKP